MINEATTRNTSGKALWRAIAGGVGLVIVLVGVPWLLTNTVGWPLPDHMPSLSELRRVVVQRDFGTSFVLGMLALAGWILWAQMLWATAWELFVNVARARARRAPRPAPLVAAPIGRIVAVAVMSVLAVVSKPTPTMALTGNGLHVPHVTSVAATVAVKSAPTSPAVATPVASQQAAASSSTVLSPTVWTVGEGDTLWDIAERSLGDGALVDEIVRLNPDLDTTSPVTVGTRVVLPHNATNGQTDVVVEEGDNLWNLTESLWGDTDMVRINEVADRNDIENPHLIYPGQVFDLTNPDAPPPPEVPSAPEVEPEEVPAEPGGSVEGPGADDAVVREGRHDDGRQGGGGGTGGITEEVAIGEGVGTRPELGDRGDGGSHRQTFEVEIDVPADDHAYPPLANGDIQGYSRNLSREGFQPPQGNPAESPVASDPDVAEQRLNLTPIGLSALMSTGVLGLLALRRRTWWQRMLSWRELSDDAIGLEMSLDTSPSQPCDVRAWTETELVEVWSAIDALTCDQRGRLLAVVNRGRAGIVAHFDTDVQMPSPWNGVGRMWTLELAAIAELRERASESVVTGTLLQLGAEPDGSAVFVDMQVVRTLEIGGPENAAEAIVVAAEVGCVVGAHAPSPLLISVGLECGQAFSRLEPLDAGTFREAEDRVHLLGERSSPGARRSRAAIVAVGPGVPNVRPLDVAGSAVISASPVNGPSHTLVPDGEFWVLRPSGIRLRPMGVTKTEAELLIELFNPSAENDARGELEHSSAAASVPMRFAGAAEDADDTIPERAVASAPRPPGADSTGSALGADPGAGGGADVGAARPEPLTVYLMGTPRVEGPGGLVERFPDPRQLELLVWLATHRGRPARTAARGAIWNFDIREDEFEYVLDGLRATLAASLGAVPEWIGHSDTELVSLHPGVTTDAEMIQLELESVRPMPPRDKAPALRSLSSRISGMPLEPLPYRWAQIEGIHHHLVGLGAQVFLDLAKAYSEIGSDVDAQDAAEEGLAIYSGHQGLFQAALDAAAARNDFAEVERLVKEYGDTLPDGPEAVAAQRSKGWDTASSSVTAG